MPSRQPAGRRRYDEDQQFSWRVTKVTLLLAFALVADITIC